MPTSEYMASLAKQYETLNKLIEEAENSQSRGESIKLYYKAQQKTANTATNTWLTRRLHVPTPDFGLKTNLSSWCGLFHLSKPGIETWYTGISTLAKPIAATWLATVRFCK